MSASSDKQVSWQLHIVTLFPDMFPGPLNTSLSGRALENGAWTCQAHDLRAFGEGRHRTVDDTPAGGGAGMVLRADIASAALTDTQNKAGDHRFCCPAPAVCHSLRKWRDLAWAKVPFSCATGLRASMSGLSKPMICKKFRLETIFCRAARRLHLSCWTLLFACYRG